MNVELSIANYIFELRLQKIKLRQQKFKIQNPAKPENSQMDFFSDRYFKKRLVMVKKQSKPQELKVQHFS
jgi:hypothetical protein